MLPQYPLALSSVACSPSTFSNPEVYGAEILSLTAETVTNYSRTIPKEYSFHHPATSLHNASFCNVTVRYTHPGQHDSILVETWLPIGNWNGRLQAVGGGGWVAGRFILSELLMSVAIAEGYATVTTDAGLGSSSTPEDWAFVSPGNVNLFALQNFASVALNDESIIAKSLIKDFYGKAQKYSYFSGCSQGGRQGLMLAQRYPNAYDGIVASAPAIFWGEVLMSAYWPQFVMNQLGHYPHPCEFDYLAEAAVEACDGLDGVIDGVISNVDACHFDPFSVVGHKVPCPDEKGQVHISKNTARVANATWSGPRASDRRFLWHGLGFAANVKGAKDEPATATTTCENGTCIGVPSNLAVQGIRLFYAKNLSFDLGSMSHQKFDSLFRTSISEYASLITTSDPDLSEFRNAGGRLITFHGLEDQIIPPGGTADYYKSVAARFSDIDDFYHHFEIPGLGHCLGGNNAIPTTGFDQLRAWVEEGIEPQTVPVSFQDAKGQKFERPLCPYPQQAHFEGGDPTEMSSFSCGNELVR